MRSGYYSIIFDQGTLRIITRNNCHLLTLESDDRLDLIFGRRYSTYRVHRYGWQ